MNPNLFLYSLGALTAVLLIAGTIQSFRASRRVSRRRRRPSANPVLAELVLELATAIRRLDSLIERVEALTERPTVGNPPPSREPAPDAASIAPSIAPSMSKLVVETVPKLAAAPVGWPAKPPAEARALREATPEAPKSDVVDKFVRRSEPDQPPLDDLEHGKIVARYVGGRILKGFTYDFYPNKPRFHLMPAIGGPMGKTIEVRVKDLKAVFFVRDFGGNPDYRERKEFLEGERPPGRKMEVTFTDGEVLVGSTVGYEPRRPAFFLIPADPKSNNLKVFVVSAAVAKVRFL